MCRVLEDEEHFVFHCDMYNHLRQRFIPECYYVPAGEGCLRDLLNSDDERVLTRLGLYISKCFTTRDEFVSGR